MHMIQSVPFWEQKFLKQIEEFKLKKGHSNNLSAITVSREGNYHTSVTISWDNYLTTEGGVKGATTQKGFNQTILVFQFCHT